MGAEGAEFETSWLDLRAPADGRARDPGLKQAALDALAARERPLVVDLACGAGATVAALANHAPPGTRWRLLDFDSVLLARAERRAQTRGLDLEMRLIDLAAPGDGLANALEGADLVTASAFFDLVSSAWIERLLAALPDRAALYAALTYSGRTVWRPAHRDDAAVLDAMNRHQRGDKGFGPALGATAAEALASALAARGRKPVVADSDWRLTSVRDRALIAELSAGIARAAQEMGVDSADWLATRSEVRAAEISHMDVFAPALA